MKQVFVASFICFTSLCYAQTTQVGRQSNAIKRLIERYHYEAKPFDDSLSSYLFNSFIEAIDPSGFYFLQSDIDHLKDHQYDIDNQIDAKTSDFFDDVAAIYRLRMITADSLITKVFETPFDFKIEENLSYKDEDQVPFVNDLEQMKERWRKWLKYSVLEELFEGYYVDNPMDTSTAALLEFVDEAKSEVEQFERFEISSFLKHPSGYKPYLATFYLDGIATYFDPHTTYFSDIENENFEAELSKDNYAYGFSLKEEDKGRILLAGLTPGGAAWMSNAMNKDDVILEITFDKKKPIDVTQLTLDELMLIFSTEDDESLVMKLQKVNGRIEEVALTKTEIYVDQDVIKSVILNGEKKIGYITLPDFYRDWDDTEGLGCANDVAKNIVKLKKENIDGLILDLRNNGGGSLKEAMDLCGIFINYGPLAIEQDKYREPKSMKDMNKGAIYMGPLAILVNSGSASASEIFSAAMQDYNRAIIVGSQTYGKSTGQVVLPLDPAFNMTFQNWDEVDESFGFLKITLSKYYRITNQTHQKEGVKPDVNIRDYYELYEYGEKFNPTALEKDEVVKKVYYTPLPKIPSASLQSDSKLRLDSNIPYQEMCTVLDKINEFTDYYDLIPLNIDAYQSNEKKMDVLFDKLYSEEEYVSDGFIVENNLFDKEIIKMDAYRAELNKEYIEIVQKDLYIGETYNVLLDYIKSK